MKTRFAWLVGALILFTTFTASAPSALAAKDLRRISDQGPVTVAATYIDPEDEAAGSSDIAFEIRMNTHSVDLDAYRHEELSVLRIDDGAEMSSLGWFEPGGGGHHVFGILKFAGPLPADARTLKLIMRDVGGVPERVFEWRLPLD